MRGPSSRLEQQILRTWNCAQCGRTIRTSGRETSHRCNCTGQWLLMKLIEEPRRKEFDSSAFHITDDPSLDMEDDGPDGLEEATAAVIEALKARAEAAAEARRPDKRYHSEPAEGESPEGRQSDSSEDDIVFTENESPVDSGLRADSTGPRSGSEDRGFRGSSSAPRQNERRPSDRANSPRHSSPGGFGGRFNMGARSESHRSDNSSRQAGQGRPQGDGRQQGEGRQRGEGRQQGRGRNQNQGRQQNPRRNPASGTGAGTGHSASGSPLADDPSAVHDHSDSLRSSTGSEDPSAQSSSSAQSPSTNESGTGPRRRSRNARRRGRGNRDSVGGRDPDVSTGNTSEGGTSDPSSHRQSDDRQVENPNRERRVPQNHDRSVRDVSGETVGPLGDASGEPGSGERKRSRNRRRRRGGSGSGERASGGPSGDNISENRSSADQPNGSME